MEKKLRPKTKIILPIASISLYKHLVTTSTRSSSTMVSFKLCASSYNKSIVAGLLLFASQTDQATPNRSGVLHLGCRVLGEIERTGERQ
jgi:hypothetical protein